MPLDRLARKLLALTTAYAIALGGVLGPALGHGFDPALQLCSFETGKEEAGEQPDRRSQHAPSDCCQGVCSAPIAILPPLETAQSVDWAGLRVPSAAVLPATAMETASSHFARAPPAH